MTFSLRPHRLKWLILAVCVACCSTATRAARADEKSEPRHDGRHPLLPGVRSDEVWNVGWPNTFHDKLLTGFSPLNCGMQRPPRVWATINPGGTATDAVFLRGDEGENFLLVQDSRLRRVDKRGKVAWEFPADRALFYDQLHGDSTWTLGARQGNTLVLLDPRTGEPFWQRVFPGTLDMDKVRVASLHPGFPGKQIAVFPQYAEMGYLFAFSPGQRAPHLLWQTEDARVANWAPQADHGVTTLLDPIHHTIWNVRHHTINVHDARTGRLVRRLEFSSGGGRRRNYGPAVMEPSANAAPLLAVTSQYVEHHLTCFRRNPSAQPTLLFDRFFGYVYDEERSGSKAKFVASGLGDADADGELDLLYAIRTGQPTPQTRTIFFDVGSCSEQVLSDTWLAGAADVDNDGRKEVFAYDDAKAEMPDLGTLVVYRFDPTGRLIRWAEIEKAALAWRPVSPLEQPPEAAWANVDLESPVVVSTAAGNGVLVRDMKNGKTNLLILEDDGIHLAETAAVVSEGRVLAIEQDATGHEPHLALETSAGTLQVVSWSGKRAFELPLRGGGTPLVSAADLMGDGRSELVVRGSSRKLRVYSVAAGDRSKQLWSAPFEGRSSRLSVPVRDVNGDGSVDVLGMGHSADGDLCVRLHAGDGRQIWQSRLPMPGSGNIVRWVVGDFLGARHSGVFVSAQQGQAREASYLLDGKNGRVVWTGRSVSTPGGMRACNPVGIPTVFDANEDGREDIVLDYRDYVAILNGADGTFLHAPTSLPPVPAGWKVAYSSFIPLYQTGGDEPHFLVPLGHGGVGLLAPDLRREVWFHKPYYDTPQKVGMIDVDGDGRIEVGYEERRDGWFVCRDLWSGREKWRLKLAGAGYGTVVTADVDGDGKGEFLIGDYCIGTTSDGRGEVRWRTGGIASAWPLIADVDGDGLGELILPGPDGLVRVLKAHHDS